MLLPYWFVVDCAWEHERSLHVYVVVYCKNFASKKEDTEGEGLGIKGEKYREHFIKEIEKQNATSKKGKMETKERKWKNTSSNKE